MKLGLLFIFYNNENDISTQQVVHHIDKTNNIEFCFIDNRSSDDTLDVLNDIKDMCNKPINVVELKKHTKTNNAVKAGARFMFNSQNIKHLGFVNVSEIKLHQLIPTVILYKSQLIRHNTSILKARASKPMLYKNIFSVHTFLKQIISKQTNEKIA